MKAETTRGKFSNPKPDLVKEVMETTKEAPIGGYGIGSNAPLKYAAIKAQISKPSKIKLAQLSQSTLEESIIIDPSEIVIPLKPLENLELSNVEKGLKDSTSSVNGYGEDTDNKRESQASSGSWPSWIYTYYTRAYDSYTMKSTSSKRNGDTISSSADNSNSLSSVAGAGVGNPASKHQEESPICPYGSILFLLGFLFPPLWWLGSIYPRRPFTSSDFKWKYYNKLMSAFSSILIVGIIGILVWYLRFYDESSTDVNSPDKLEFSSIYLSSDCVVTF
ncbi:20816_t:CDS:2 [Entrophospora sp. SA101]|nr:132_t:CDS:2 [Entrophospora sp. SA101]CAJ0756627.1 20816_t:CDS:2 [Entrophospora sp. SA101]CAJ0879708.1 13999_t:CDS:2 [Entrophospora sp. SA101]